MTLKLILSVAGLLAAYVSGYLYKKERLPVLFVVLAENIAVMVLLLMLHPDIHAVAAARLTFLCSLLVPVALSDFREQKIPNKLLLAGVIFWVVSLAVELFYDTDRVFGGVIESIIAAGGIFLVCMVCLLIFHGSIGMGDVKLFLLMGLLQGVNGLFSAIFFSLIISFFMACGLLISRKKTKKDNMSFGPAILIGTTLSVLMGGC